MNSTVAIETTIPSVRVNWIQQHASTGQDLWNEWQAFLASKQTAIREETQSTTPMIEVSFETQNPTLLTSNEEAESQFESVFRSAREVPFEDGTENEFSRHLTTLMGLYGPFFKDILAGLFEDESISPDVLSEALRWLGRMDDKSTHESRLWLLERALNLPSASIRDGAILGLASMDDPSAIRYLELAIQREQIPELRRDMEQVLEQLNRR